jgi:hypothetical protein
MPKVNKRNNRGKSMRNKSELLSSAVIMVAALFILSGITILDRQLPRPANATSIDATSKGVTTRITPDTPEMQESLLSDGKLSVIPSTGAGTVATAGIMTPLTEGSGGMPANATPAGELAGSSQVDFEIEIALPQTQALEDYLNGLNDQSSIYYHHYLSFQEFYDRYGPNQSQIELLLGYFQSNGLTVTATGGPLLYNIEGTAVSVSAALHTSLYQYKLGSAETIIAPLGVVELPAQIASLVESVLDLNGFNAAQPMLSPSSLTSCTTSCGNTTPEEMREFYDESSIMNESYSGQGTIGLAEVCDATETAAGYLSDLGKFDSLFGLPSADVQFNGSGSSTCDEQSGWSIETDMDIQWAHVMAPNAKLFVCLDNYNPPVDCDQTFVQRDIPFGSNSWTIKATSFDSIWESAMAAGITLLSASGDGGWNNQQESLFPAAEPYGLAVGGTSICNSDNGCPNAGSYGQEYGWSNGDGASGGGCSNETAPSWQQGIGQLTSRCSTHRGYPDVAMDGDPLTGVDAYIEGTLYTGRGGTSLATPMWAAALDVIYQASGFSGFAPPVLYSLNHVPVVNYTYFFHDITIGSSDGLVTPTNDWDFVTGIGTPDIAHLVEAFSPPSLPIITLSPANPAPGDPVYLHASFSGGAGDYFVNNTVTGWVVIPVWPSTATAICSNPIITNWYNNTLAGASTLYCPSGTVSAGGYDAQYYVDDALGIGSVSSVFAFYVEPPLSVSITTSRPSADNGQEVYFNATASGGVDDYTYEWYGLPSSCPAIYAVSVACVMPGPAPYNLSVKVTDYFGDYVQEPQKGLSYTVYADPTISVSPSGPFVYDENETANYLAEAITYSGSNTATYYWYNSSSAATCNAKSGNRSASGATSSGGALTPSTRFLGTTYYCAVIFDSGIPDYSYPSDAVEVTVIADPTVSVTIPSVPFTYDEGQASATLTAKVTYTGSNTDGVEWYGSTSSSCGAGSTDTNVPGTTFTIPTSSPGVTYYCAVVFDSGVPGYALASGAVEVIVYADPTASVSPSLPLSYDVGQTAITLTAKVTYNGLYAATVEWYGSESSNCGSGSGSIDTGVSGTTFTPYTTSAWIGTTYYCAVVFDSGVPGYSYASNAVAVTVHTDPTVRITPSGLLTYDVGQAALLTADIAYGGPNADPVEWYSSASSSCDSGAIDTTDSGTTFTASTSSVGTTYYCAVVSDLGVPGYASTSNAVEVTVYPDPTVTAPSTWPSVDEGAAETFTTAVTGGMGPFTYTWVEPFGSFVDGGCVHGGYLGHHPPEYFEWNTSVPFTTCDPPTQAGEYLNYVGVFVTDSNDYSTSTDVAWGNLLVNSDPTVSITPSGPLTYDVGQTATALTATVTYSGQYGYTVEWYNSSSANCDWNSIDMGVSGTTLTPYTTSGSVGTTYYCTVVTDSGVPAASDSIIPGYFNASNAVEVTVYPDPQIGGSDEVNYLTTVYTGPYPWGVYVDVDSATNTAYVVDSTDATITEINLVSDSIILTIPIPYGDQARGVWFDQATGLIWVCPSYNSVMAFNGATGALVYNISVGPPNTESRPTSLAYDPTDNTLWVTDFFSSEVSEISLTSNSVVATLTTPEAFPYSIAIDDTTQLAFITVTSTSGHGLGGHGSSYDMVLVLNLATQEFQTSAMPTSVPDVYSTVAVDPISSMVYVTDEATGTVTAFNEFDYTDPSTFVTAVAPYGAFGVALDPALGLAFVTSANAGYGQFYCMGSLSWVVATPNLLTGSLQIAFDTELNLAVVASVGSPSGLVIYDVSGLASECLSSSGRTVQGIPWASTTGQDPDVGLTVMFHATVSGGTGIYSYVWSGLPTGCTTQDTLTLPCTPTGAGTFSVTLTVTDSNGMSVTSGVLRYVVCTDPTIATPTASSPSVDVGQAITFSTSTSGGSGGNVYTWTGLPTGCISANVSAFSCTVTAAGTYNIVITVTDSNGVTVKSATLTYVVDTDPTIATPTPSAESFGVGESFTLSVTPSGGSGSFSSIVWSISDSGLGCTLGNTLSIQCVPTSVGSYTASVAVTDSNGYTVTSTALSLFVMDWNYGNLCSVQKGNCQFTGSSHCDPALAYSFNGSYQTLNVRITGSSDCVYLNVSGSHDVVNIQVTGSSMPYLQTIMAGMNDFLNIAITGSSDSSFAYVFGQKDVYNLTVTGSSVVAKTYFLGFDPTNDSAPAGNLSRTDSYHLKMTGSTDTQSIAYVNSVGWSSAVHKVSAPKNIATGSSDYLQYQNMTGVWGGPWDTTSGLPSFVPSTPTGTIVAGEPD